MFKLNNFAQQRSEKVAEHLAKDGLKRVATKTRAHRQRIASDQTHKSEKGGYRIGKGRGDTNPNTQHLFLLGARMRTCTRLSLTHGQKHMHGACAAAAKNTRTHIPVLAARLSIRNPRPMHLPRATHESFRAMTNERLPRIEARCGHP
jgi:hypothetical protein